MESRDQTGRTVVVPFPPKRIISLVPSQTELLHSLGLDQKVAGITRFCVRPEEWYRSRPRVGGTKSLHLDKIEELNPDLIIANKEENEKDQILALAEKFPVWVSNISTLTESEEMILEIGRITGTAEKAKEIATRIQDGFQNIKPLDQPVPTLYLIWKNPYMSIGGDTFISNILRHCGFTNILSEKTRYPEITIAEIRALQPGLIILSSEPYPFKEFHIKELQILFPDTEIILADGEMFSWYGSRLLYAPDYLNGLIKQVASQRK